HWRTLRGLRCGPRSLDKRAQPKLSVEHPPDALVVAPRPPHEITLQRRRVVETAVPGAGIEQDLGDALADGRRVQPARLGRIESDLVRSRENRLRDETASRVPDDSLADPV